MKKIQRVLALSAAGVQLLSLLVYIGTILLQNPLKKLFGASPELLGLSFSSFIPIVDTLSMLGLTALILLLALFAPRSRSILPEIAGIVLLTLSGTLLYNLLSSLEMSLLGSWLGTYHIASRSLLLGYLGVAQFISGIAKSLALTLCGMSLVMKKAHKKPAAVQ